MRFQYVVKLLGEFGVRRVVCDYHGDWVSFEVGVRVFGL